MKFRVIKSYIDGLSDTGTLDLDEVKEHIICFKGWDNRDQLLEAIQKWGKKARPGDVFCTQVSAIVAVGSHRADQECPECLCERLSYDDHYTTDECDVYQDVKCLGCGYRWRDVFYAAERVELTKGGRAKK